MHSAAETQGPSPLQATNEFTFDKPVPTLHSGTGHRQFYLDGKSGRKPDSNAGAKAGLGLSRGGAGYLDLRNFGLELPQTV